MWIDELQNPQAIKSVFPICPELNGVELMSIAIDRDGPTVTVSIGINELPQDAPSRWKLDSVNAVVIKLQLLAVSTVRIDRWSTVNIVQITLGRKGPESIMFKAIGATTSFECEARFIRALSLTPYRQQQLTS